MNKQFMEMLAGDNLSQARIIMEKLLSMPNCFVGWVQSYNSDKKTVTILPAIKQSAKTVEQPTDLFTNRPLYVDVWVLSNALGRPPQIGDKAVCFVLDQKSNAFFKTAYNQSQSLAQQTFVPSNKNFRSQNDLCAIIVGEGSGGGGTTDYADLENKPKINNVELIGNKTLEELGIEIPDPITSINGLGGGKLTSALILDGGDAITGVANIQLGTSGQITAQGTTATLFGRNSATSLLVGHNSHALALRGSATRPTYNGNSLALSSDLGDYVAISDIVNSTSSTATNQPLSANAGKQLQDQINNLNATGRFLSGWNCVTGQPTTQPFTSLPYTYKAGDYYIVRTVASAGGVNFMPDGAQYTGTPSTTVESDVVQRNDYFRYDGSVWELEINTQRVVSFQNIEGDPLDNSDLASEFAKYVPLSSVSTSSTANTIVQRDANKNIYGNYLVGTWLQTTATTDLASWTDVFVNSGGWLYKRNKADFKSDLGIPNLYLHKVQMLKRSGLTIIGRLLISIVNSDSTPITSWQLLIDNQSKIVNVTGHSYESSVYYMYYDITSIDYENYNIMCRYFRLGTSASADNTRGFATSAFPTDTVTAL